MRVRSAYLLRHSRPAVRRLPGLPHPPRSVDTLRSPERGRHRPVYGTPLESSRAPSRCNRNLTGSQQEVRDSVALCFCCPPCAVTNPSSGRTKRRLPALLSFSLPSALAESGIRFSQAMHRLPRSGLSVSHALAGFRPPRPFGCISTRNAPGIRPSGLFPRGEPCLSRDLSSLAVRRCPGHPYEDRDRFGFRGLLPPRVRSAGGVLRPRLRSLPSWRSLL